MDKHQGESLSLWLIPPWCYSYQGSCAYAGGDALNLLPARDYAHASGGNAGKLKVWYSIPIRGTLSLTGTATMLSRLWLQLCYVVHHTLAEECCCRCGLANQEQLPVLAPLRNESLQCEAEQQSVLSPLLLPAARKLLPFAFSHFSGTAVLY